MTSKFHHEEIYRGSLVALSKPLIVVCGAGALGSNFVDNITRQGFTRIRVIDLDRVELQNINTQVYGETDIGALKVGALKNRVFRNVSVELETIDKELTASTADKFLKGADLVVDCFDNSKSRRIVQDTCRAKKIRCLHIGLFESMAETVFDEHYKVPADQVEGDVCDYPLARNIAMLAVIVATEEILDLYLSKKPRLKNWSITLKDLKIQESKGHV
jgi:molybdopterin/thiamine biosynthesis adenylyltransferase